jgi:hypothetical protein
LARCNGGGDTDGDPSDGPAWTAWICAEDIVVRTSWWDDGGEIDDEMV